MTELVSIEQPTETTTRNVRSLKNCYSTDIRDHFPMTTIRQGQDLAIDAFLESLRLGRKFTIIRGKTGCGKSGIGMTIASFSKVIDIANDLYKPGAYVLSPLKSLTKQYMGDFGTGEGRWCDGLLELKGKSNYTCTLYRDDENPDEFVDCETGMAMCSKAKKDADKLDDEEAELVPTCSYCPYKAAKRAVIENDLNTLNYAYFLGETNHAGQLPLRNTIILDEGHNIEKQILGFADTVITKYRMRDVNLDCAIPTVDPDKPGDVQRGYEWLLKTFRPALITTIGQLEVELEESRRYGKPNAKKAKKLNGLKMFLNKLNRYVNADEPSDWLLWTENSKHSKSFGDMTIRPLTAKYFANELLFNKAEHIVIMSATIPEFGFFMKNLGIDPNDAVCIDLPSEFAKENRRIHVRPVGFMTSGTATCPSCKGKSKFIDLTLPKMADKVSEIMMHPQFADKKGIVHTASYTVNRYLTSHLAPELSERISTHDNADERAACLEHHFSTEIPSFLFSPSMEEGLDLKEDLSRCSIMVKVPYPALDPYVKARQRRDEEWYANETAQKMEQAYGRSNRTPEDKAHHFILDTAFLNFYTKSGHLFSEYFREALDWGQSGVPFGTRYPSAKGCTCPHCGATM